MAEYTDITGLLNKTNNAAAQQAALEDGVASDEMLNASDFVSLVSAVIELQDESDEGGDISGKADKVSGVSSLYQMAALDYGGNLLDSGLNKSDITGIMGKIPTQASSSNQLADKDFVNSSISTNTATFKGTYTNLNNLYNQRYCDKNDYAFYVTTDSAGNTLYKRYKYISDTPDQQGSSVWSYEYDLNNSSFTSEQWAAIQSGITSSLVSKLSALPTNDSLTASLAAKQNTLTFDSYLQPDKTGVMTTENINSEVANKIAKTSKYLGEENKVDTATDIGSNMYESSAVTIQEGKVLIITWPSSSSLLGIKVNNGSVVTLSANTPYTIPITDPNQTLYASVKFVTLYGKFTVAYKVVDVAMTTTDAASRIKDVEDTIGDIATILASVV